MILRRNVALSKILEVKAFDIFHELLTKGLCLLNSFQFLKQQHQFQVLLGISIMNLSYFEFLVKIGNIRSVI